MSFYFLFTYIYIFFLSVHLFYFSICMNEYSEFSWHYNQYVYKCDLYFRFVFVSLFLLKMNKNIV